MCLKQLPLVFGPQGGSWRDLPVLFQKLHLLMLFATLEEEGGCPPRVGAVRPWQVQESLLLGDLT